ncbi:MAG TPA: 4a-hydroxytetrahydrobiopterin dehydratase [Bacteroidia bacterium]|nr:4a-hydroxytetrahydrobiopterin dehydratase [Bacteroidia bacterium]HNT79253.1 4a-hydroxytetrahydrobiopterin dehydratase [Bacteroidia bacterium]
MNWSEQDNKLVGHFSFPDFVQAFSFLSKVALIAEEKNHHPEIYNCYNKVTLCLSTHDAGGIVTEKDRDLAKCIDELL